MYLICTCIYTDITYLVNEIYVQLTMYMWKKHIFNKAFSAKFNHNHIFAHEQTGSSLR